MLYGCGVFVQSRRFSVFSNFQGMDWEADIALEFVFFSS